MRIPKRVVKKHFVIGNNSYTMQDLVNLKNWQQLRESLVGTWKTNKKENIKKLESWLGPVEKASTRKLLIMRNYLTGSAFRLGKIQDSSLTKLKNKVITELRTRDFNVVIK